MFLLPIGLTYHASYIDRSFIDGGCVAISIKLKVSLVVCIKYIVFPSNTIFCSSLFSTEIICIWDLSLKTSSISNISMLKCQAYVIWSSKSPSVCSQANTFSIKAAFEDINISTWASIIKFNNGGKAQRFVFITSSPQRLIKKPVYITNLTLIPLENRVYAALNGSVVSSKLAEGISCVGLTRLSQELRGYSFGILFQTNLTRMLYTCMYNLYYH